MNRYQKQIRVPQIGHQGQTKINQAKILVVGAGGLGCPVLQYLNAAGVGQLGIVDGDIVQESNLHRQILFTEADIGKMKVQIAKAKLRQQNSNTTIETYPFFIENSNIFELIEKYDLIIDGSDNFSTRYLVNDACFFAKKPLVFGSILQFEGQVTCFNIDLGDHQRSANYRDLYPQPPNPKEQMSCDDAGVPGTLPGIVGTIMANEALKHCIQPSSCLIEELLLIAGFQNTYQTIRYQKNDDNPISGKNPTQFGLIDYQDFCHQSLVPTLSWKQFTDLRKTAAVKLVDVRTREEHELDNKGGEHIPLNQLSNRLTAHANEVIVFYCQSGNRSEQAVRLMQELNKHGRFYSIADGMEAIEQES